MFDIFVVIPDCRDVPMSSRSRPQLVTHYRVVRPLVTALLRQRGVSRGEGVVWGNKAVLCVIF